MQIAFRCGKCQKIYLSDKDEDLSAYFDFVDKKIIFICKNQKCMHHNEFDMDDWKKKQIQSPLPKMRTL